MKNPIATLAFLLIAVIGSTRSYPQDYHQDYAMDEPAAYEYDVDDGSNFEDDSDVNYADIGLPEFTVKEQTYAVQEGGDVNISCSISGSTPYVLIVKKVGGPDEEKLLFVGEVKVAINYKHEIHDGTVTIKNVSRNDAGDYKCYFESEPLVELTHKLDVQYAPTVSSPTAKNQRVTKGDSVSLECKAEGNPIPKITWSRAGGRLPAGFKEEEGSAITMLDVDRHVEGTYTCKANNSIGNPATEEMTITVEYAPEIVTEKAIVRTGEGDKVELVCIVYSRPASEVTWQKDGSSVDHKPNMEESEGGHRHTLMLEKISEEMFGDYTCHASNDNGEADATINLTDLPKPPHFTSEINGGEETSYTLTFETESYYPITEYQIKYRKANDSQTNDWVDLGSMDVVPEDVNTTEMDHTLKYTIEGLEQATEYEVVAAVKNQNKWSNESAFQFSTKKAIPTTTTTTTTSTTTTTTTTMASPVDDSDDKDDVEGSSSSGDKDKPQSRTSTNGCSSLLGASTSMLVIAATLLLNH